MAPLGEGPTSSLDPTFGAFLIGVFFAIFFQGLLTVQAWSCFDNFPDDQLSLRLLVSWVWLLDTIHLVVICQTSYHYLVTNWGYQPVLVQSSPELTLHIILIGLASFSCQMFFLLRIWVFSHQNKLICGLVLVVCVATLFFSLYLPLLFNIRHFTLRQLADVKPETTILFLTGALSDILLSSLLCYYLRFSDGRSNFQAMRSVISQILLYVVVTGLLTSCVGIAAAVAFLLRPQELYYIAMHLLLGRLYTNSLLATLNSRKKIRQTLHRGDFSVRPHITSFQSTHVNVPPPERALSFNTHVAKQQKSHKERLDRTEIMELPGIEVLKSHSLA